MVGVHIPSIFFDRDMPLPREISCSWMRSFVACGMNHGAHAVSQAPMRGFWGRSIVIRADGKGLCRASGSRSYGGAPLIPKTCSQQRAKSSRRRQKVSPVWFVRQWHWGRSPAGTNRALPFAGQVVQANSTMSLEREAALISGAALDNQKAPAGALDFDLQVQDMSKVMAQLCPHGLSTLCSQPAGGPSLAVTLCHEPAPLACRLREVLKR